MAVAVVDKFQAHAFFVVYAAAVTVVAGKAVVMPFAVQLGRHCQTIIPVVRPARN
jgi:hypothetical protein